MKKWKVDGYIERTQDFTVTVPGATNAHAEAEAVRLQQLCHGQDVLVRIVRIIEESEQKAADLELILECEALATQVINDPNTTSATDVSDLCKRVLELTYVLRHRLGVP